MSASKTEDVLHLFSSDLRPLYLEDCLEVLALPPGSVHRFRYDRRHVWLKDAQREQIATQWESLEKRKTRVLVYFVGAKTRRYGADIYVPLRWGRVVRAFAEGPFLVVDFAVESYADPHLFRALPSDGNLPVAELRSVTAEDRFSDARRDWAIQLTSSIDLQLSKRAAAGSRKDVTGRYSAVLDTQPTQGGEVPASEQSAAFERLVSLLDDLLGPSARPGNASDATGAFFRVLGVRKVNGRRLRFKAAYKLRTAVRYELEILHLNPSGLSDKVSFTIPDSLSAFGNEAMELSGRYDVRSYAFLVKPKENVTYGEITIANEHVRADAAITRARIRFLAMPRKAFGFLNWMIAVGTMLAAFAIALNSARAIITTTPIPEVALEYVDLSILVNWIWPGAYLAVAAGAILPGALAAIVAGLVAVGAVFRRRWGLSASAQQ
jgi:hypothetical protein